MRVLILAPRWAKPEQIRAAGSITVINHPAVELEAHGVWIDILTATPRKRHKGIFPAKVSKLESHYVGVTNEYPSLSYTNSKLGSQVNHIESLYMLSRSMGEIMCRFHYDFILSLMPEYSTLPHLIWDLEYRTE